MSTRLRTVLILFILAATPAFAGCAFSQQTYPTWLKEQAETEVGTPWQSVFEINDVVQFKGNLSCVRLNTLDSHVVELLSRSTTLTQLDLSFVGLQITDDQIKQLCNCQSIEWLDISNSQKLTDKALASISTLPRLSTLIAQRIGDRAGGRKFSVQGLELLAACTSLNVFDLGMAGGIGENPYSRYGAVSKIKSLSELRGVSPKAANAAALCDLPNLSTSGARSDEAVEVFAHRSRIESLRLVGNEIGKESFWALEYARSLREIVVSDETSVWDTQEIGNSLGNCSRLDALTLSQVHTVNYSANRRPDEEKIRWWLDDLALKRLLLLPFADRAVARCAHLRHLNLDGNPNLTSDGIKTICEAYPELVSLSLQGCAKLDGRVLDAIATLKNLKHLRIGYTFVIDKWAAPAFTPDDAGKLAKLSKLSKLNSLDISGTDPGFANEAVGVALRWKNLESLRATYCGLTDESIKGAQAASLNRLDLSSNSISNGGVRTLSKSLPKLTALALDNCSNINVDELGSDLTECTNLVALRLKQNDLDLAKLKQFKTKLSKCAIEY